MLKVVGREEIRMVMEMLDKANIIGESIDIVGSIDDTISFNIEEEIFRPFLGKVKRKVSYNVYNNYSSGKHELLKCVDEWIKIV